MFMIDDINEIFDFILYEIINNTSEWHCDENGVSVNGREIIISKGLFISRFESPKYITNVLSFSQRRKLHNAIVKRQKVELKKKIKADIVTLMDKLNTIINPIEIAKWRIRRKKDD